MKWSVRSLATLTMVAAFSLGLTQVGCDSGPKNVDADISVEELELPEICDNEEECEALETSAEDGDVSLSGPSN